MVNDGKYIDPSQFPTNSNASKREGKPRAQKVVKGQVIRKKKPLRSRLSEVFVEENVDSVGSYLVMDVLIPAAKNLIADMVGEGIQRVLFGEGSSGYSRPHSSSSRGYTSYSSISKPSYSSSGPSSRREVTRHTRATHSFDDIILPTRGEAETVLDRMLGRLDQYDLVTVSDFYDFLDVTSQPTDENWGWTELRGLCRIKRVPQGYLIQLPAPSPIE